MLRHLESFNNLIFHLITFSSKSFTSKTVLKPYWDLYWSKRTILGRWTIARALLYLSTIYIFTSLDLLAKGCTGTWNRRTRAQLPLPILYKIYCQWVGTSSEPLGVKNPESIPSGTPVQLQKALYHHNSSYWEILLSYGCKIQT